MGNTLEHVEYSSLSTDTLVALRRIFAQWPRGGIGVARVRLNVVERVLEARGVDLAGDAPTPSLDTPAR